MNDLMSIRDLVARLSEALREYDRLVFDEQIPHELGSPASQDQIHILEGSIGKPLPPSYRAFLLLHNGWSDFSGGSKILSVEDQRSGWVQQKIAYWNDLWEEDLPNPFEMGMIPVVFGVDENSFLVLDPSSVRENGEMDFVMYDYMHEERRFEDFNQFLLRKMDVLQFLIDRETIGVLEDDAIESNEDQ